MSPRDLQVHSESLANRIADTFIHRVREWLDPPPFAERYDDAASQCARGTTGWLLEHPNYLAWSRDDFDFQKQNLWVRGEYGRGGILLC